MKEEREERERKRKIESLQKLIKKEMQQKHRRCQTDVNSANSSTHIPNSHADCKDSSKTPCFSSATNTTEQPTVGTDSADTAEQTSPSSISTDVDIVRTGDDTTVDEVALATTVEVHDAALVLTEDDESKTDHCPTESEDLAVYRDYAEQLHTVLPDAEASICKQIFSIKGPPVQDTVAPLITQPAAHKSDASPTVLLLTTELQIQQTNGAVITQSEANEEFDATATVQTTTNVTKTPQYHSKELQTQDTTVSMTQPRATQVLNLPHSSPQIQRLDQDHMTPNSGTI